MKLRIAQVTEVGRNHNGVVEPVRERGPKFRALYSGYGALLSGELIPIKRVPEFAQLLGRCLSWKERRMSVPQQRESPLSAANSGAGREAETAAAKKECATRTVRYWSPTRRVSISAPGEILPKRPDRDEDPASVQHLTEDLQQK